MGNLLEDVELLSGQLREEQAVGLRRRTKCSMRRRVTVGASSASPAATVRMPSASRPVRRTRGASRRAARRRSPRSLPRRGTRMSISTTPSLAQAPCSTAARRLPLTNHLDVLVRFEHRGDAAAHDRRREGAGSTRWPPGCSARRLGELGVEGLLGAMTTEVGGNRRAEGVADGRGATPTWSWCLLRLDCENRPTISKAPDGRLLHTTAPGPSYTTSTDLI